MNDKTIAGTFTTSNEFTNAKEWRAAFEKAKKDIDKNLDKMRLSNQDYVKQCAREHKIFPNIIDYNSFGKKDFLKMDIDDLVEIEELIDVDITKIIKSGPATIVFFNDGEKIVVKRAADDEDSVYTAVAYAITKKIYGNNSHFKKMVNDHLIEQDNNKSKNDSDPITYDVLKELLADFKIGIDNLKQD